MFMGKGRILLLICIFYMGRLETGIVRVDTISTVDDKRITFLGDNHGLNEGEHEQVNGILDFLRQCEKNNKPTHILLEQASWLGDVFGCESEVLFSLSKQIKQKTSNFTCVTFENIDIRYAANFARDILIFPVPHQMDREPDRIIDTTQKTLSTLTFQDVLDEFNQIKESLSAYYSQQNNPVVSEVYTKHITWADTHYKKLLQIMENDGISPDTFILKYAKKNCLIKKAPLASTILETFSRLCDLHIIRTLSTSPHKNMVVMAGFQHTEHANLALQDFSAFSLYSAGKDTTKYTRLITSAQLRQGLFAQEPSSMAIYPVISKGATAVVLCYFLYAIMLQIVM